MRVLRPLFLSGDRRKSSLERSHGKSVRVKQSAEDFEQEFIQEQMKSLIFTTVSLLGVGRRTAKCLQRAEPLSGSG